jgi:hypothetical protein
MITTILEVATASERAALARSLQHPDNPADDAGLVAAYSALQPTARTYEQALGLVLADARQALGPLAPPPQLADSLWALEDQVREAATLLTTPPSRSSAVASSPLLQRASSVERLLPTLVLIHIRRRGAVEAKIDEAL